MTFHLVDLGLAIKLMYAMDVHTFMRQKTNDEAAPNTFTLQPNDGLYTNVTAPPNEAPPPYADAGPVGGMGITTGPPASGSFAIIRHAGSDTTTPIASNNISKVLERFAPTLPPTPSSASTSTTTATTTTGATHVVVTDAANGTIPVIAVEAAPDAASANTTSDAALQPQPVSLLRLGKGIGASSKQPRGTLVNVMFTLQFPTVQEDYWFQYPKILQHQHKKKRTPGKRRAASDTDDDNNDNDKDHAMNTESDS
jgi:hypothetical protein